ncbi:hypothetical protein [Nonomuraea zeae]|uniref:hypothetical protein n=1 Tax=Nonomuraea zeae TaxID=1642303 RepID=UPI001478EB87|nr:hypothetical protein [Nonomuraea zeae]
MGRHLVAAERALEDDDPDQAHEHTKVARRFAARIGVVREAAGIVAYRAGHFSEALSDLRAARRMTGSDAYLPVMADCERGLGRPERAIDLVRSPEAERLDRAGRIELTIVESGARRDLGQHDAAVITLQRLPELRDPQAKPWSARLAFAYADALAHAGHQEAATDWFGRAMAFDDDGETDAAERYAELTGAVIEDVEEDSEYEDYEDSEGLESSDDSEDSEDLEDSEDYQGSRDADSADSEASKHELDEADDLDVADDEDDEDDEDHLDLDDLDEEDSIDEEGIEDAEADEEDEDADENAALAEAGDLLDREPDRSAPANASQAAETDSADVPGAPVGPRPASGSSEQADMPAITPAFIEPNFGDRADESDEPVKDKSKTDE